MTSAPGGTDGSDRWWLDPALARIAFGPGTTPGGRSDRSVVERAIRNADGHGPGGADAERLVLGEFELLEEVGEGGTGVVYRARQRGLERDVALKLLAAGHEATPALVDALRREACHAARLQHPNIVTVHGLGEHDGLLCYAMQLVRGRSLSQRIDAEGPLAPAAAARMLRTLAEAIHYAHRLGVLHLDLKPANILIDESGEPLVTDFGLARTLGPGMASGQAAGTPSYMAPEQLDERFGPLSPATDVWALGAILYECLTGHAPFEASTPEETLRLLLEAEVRRPSRYARIPPDLEAICRHCLAKQPGLRYPGARELAEDLGRYLDDREVTVRRPPVLQRMLRRARREPREVLILALLGLLVLALGVLLSPQWHALSAAACAAPG
jgi:serine/threonine protein kinase